MRRRAPRADQHEDHPERVRASSGPAPFLFRARGAGPGAEICRALIRNFTAAVRWPRFIRKLRAARPGAGEAESPPAPGAPGGRRQRPVLALTFVSVKS